MLDTCAVLDDGSAACWGNDSHGKLGNGAALIADQQSPSPVPLPAGRRATAIFAAETHTCALRAARERTGSRDT